MKGAYEVSPPACSVHTINWTDIGRSSIVYQSVDRASKLGLDSFKELRHRIFIDGVGRYRKDLNLIVDVANLLLGFCQLVGASSHEHDSFGVGPRKSCRKALSVTVRDSILLHGQEKVPRGVVGGLSAWHFLTHSCSKLPLFKFSSFPRHQSDRVERDRPSLAHPNVLLFMLHIEASHLVNIRYYKISVDQRFPIVYFRFSIVSISWHFV